MRGTIDYSSQRKCSSALFFLVLWAVLSVGAARAEDPPPQLLTQDDKAGILIESANRAFNEQQYPVAADRYREYIKSFASSKDIHHARYGLAMCAIEGPQKDWKVALENLTAVSAEPTFSEKAFAAYYQSLALRSLADDALAQAIAKPAEAANWNKVAADHFALALPKLNEAAAAFIARAQAGPIIEGAVLSIHAEWALRARCDQAELLLRLDKPQESRAITEPFVDKALLAKSRYRNSLLYLHGHACFLLQDYLPAGQSLSQLAPFNDPVHGPHAQYLLARTHHLLQDRNEAQSRYAAVREGYEKQKAAAQKTLQNQALMQNQPDEKSRLEQLLKSPPEYVVRAQFYDAVLLYELEKFTEAQAGFAAYVKAYPQSPLAAEAQLRQGMSEVQLRQFQPAEATLSPLFGNPQLADRALLYSARAAIGFADRKQVPQFTQTLTQMAERLRQAAEKANQLVAQEPGAKLRRAECQMELGDTLLLAKDFVNSAATYNAALAENNDPQRTEDFLLRVATALHLAGQFDPSEQICQRYTTQYPRGVHLGSILFRSAENTFAKAAALDADKNVAPVPDAAKLYAEAINRHRQVVDKFPDLPQVATSRFRLGLANYRLANYPKALAELELLDVPDRQGDLAAASYYQADILIRGLSNDASDALAAGRQVQALENAVKHLEAFSGADLASPLAPDALLKLGVCYSRLGELTADVNERKAALDNALKQFAAIAARFPAHPVMARGVFEQAKTRLLANDPNNAIADLVRFQADPFKNSEIAPLALLRLASLYRAQNKFDDAVKVLAAARQLYEGPLSADPVKQTWALLLQYQHGLALQQSNKLADARAQFENLIQKYPTRSEIYEAAWRVGQCRREDGRQKLDAARKVLVKPDAKPEEKAAVAPQIVEIEKQLTEAGQSLVTSADLLKASKRDDAETLQRLLYEAGACHRMVAEYEIETARKKLAEDITQKTKEELARRYPAPAKSPQARTPEISMSFVAMQPGEQLARRLFAEAIKTRPDSTLAQVARVELSELHALRDEKKVEMSLLQEALNAELTAELEERVRLRLGAALLAAGDAPQAAAMFSVVAANEKSSAMPDARYWQGEALLAQKEWTKAIERFAGFRDLPPLQNLPGLSDRALLRLGYALAQAGQWEPSRLAYEQFVARFGAASALRFDARYGQAWSLQQQKQFDAAVNMYRLIIDETAGEISAKSQFQIGVCRAEQKRSGEAYAAFLMVADAYDYPSYAAPALLEAAQLALTAPTPESQGTSVKLYSRVVRDYPNTEWAKAAQEQLVKQASVETARP